MKEYGQLLADDPQWAATRARVCRARPRRHRDRARELGPPRAPRHPLALRVAYHDACHLAHAQGVRQPPRDLLRSIPGLELLPFAEQEICCGSAGIYNLVEPEPRSSSAIARPATSTRVQPDVVATANPGCMLQIRAGAARQQQTWTVVHPIELLDAAIRGKGVQEL